MVGLALSGSAAMCRSVLGVPNSSSSSRIMRVSKVIAAMSSGLKILASMTVHEFVAERLRVEG